MTAYASVPLKTIGNKLYQWGDLVLKVWVSTPDGSCYGAKVLNVALHIVAVLCSEMLWTVI
jgi:hypothetical protein